jgi:hypothetical protein
MRQIAGRIKADYDLYTKCIPIYSNLVNTCTGTNNTGYSSALKLIQEQDQGFRDGLKPFLELPNTK